MKFKRTASRCSECPFRGQKKVWGTSDIDKAQVILLGEAPGAQEDAEGKPFVGMAGAKLKEGLSYTGLIWHTLHKTNVICCRPPNNDMSSPEAQDALECCRPGFEQEMEWLKKQGARVVVPLGNTALDALGIQGKIGKVRGSVYPVMGGLVAVPTYHPSYIMRGMFKEEPTWIADLTKARDLSLKKWKPPVEKFNIKPTEGDVKEFVEEALRKKALVAVDIETTSLSPFFSRILMIGLAMNGQEALVVPFAQQGGANYWDVAEEVRVRTALKKLFAGCPTMFQNAMFDVAHLEAHGYAVKDIREDTMLAHFAIHPELPHNLEYIVSVYGETPAWKAAVKGSMSRLIDMDVSESRTYNARDTVALHQIIGPLHKDLEEGGTMLTYRRWCMRLVRPLLEMSKEGMLIDKKRLEKAKKQFKKDTEGALKEMKKIVELPEGFNFESNYHMQYLVYGEKPKSYAKWYEELSAYHKPSSKQNKNTKKYRELKAKVEMYDLITPLRLPVGLTLRKTATGFSTDDEAFLAIRQKAYSRLEGMEDLVRKTKAHDEERRGLQRTVDFLVAFGKYSAASKLSSTYSGYPIGPDGRVHPSYKIHGAATGRLSASEPNLQNQPAIVQDIFVAAPGKVIIKADYSNIELRVLAYLTGDETLIGAFKSGQNIHSVNAKTLFGVDESHPNWHDIRRAAKVFAFGRGYGGGFGGIYKQIITQVPELNLSYSHFVECDRAYFAKMKRYAEWADRMRKQARETRVVQTAFGRKRILLGTPDEIERQGLNTPVQGTAGEIAEEAICDLYDEVEKPGRKKWAARLVLTVHDSILVEVNKEYEEECSRLMKKVMEKEWVIEGRKVSFPVDIETGPSWGETKPVEV